MCSLLFCSCFSPSEAVPSPSPSRSALVPLLSRVRVLQKTDITDCSLAALACSKVKRVWLAGRRGPLQVAFTIKVRLEGDDFPSTRPQAALALWGEALCPWVCEPRCPKSCSCLLPPGPNVLGEGSLGLVGGTSMLEVTSPCIFLPAIPRSCGR